jgi:ankyrin repeat protein
MLVAYKRISPGLLKDFPNLGKDPNEIRNIGGIQRTALIDADFEDTKALLRLKGINVNAQTPNNSTALNRVNRGSIDIIRLLLEAGANTEMRDKWGDAPLHDAVASGNLEVAALLIKAGADVNVRTFNLNFTPLMLAVGIEHAGPQMVQLLINSGADVNAYDGFGKTVWGHAAGRSGQPGMDEIRKMLRAAGAKEINKIPPEQMKQIQQAKEAVAKK